MWIKRLVLFTGKYGTGEATIINISDFIKNLITREPQLHRMGGVWATHFSGVCGLDGHSQAPMDGLMASREMGSPYPGFLAEHQGNQIICSFV